MAPLRGWRSLDLERSRLVLDVGLSVGMGDVPLWPMAPKRTPWLGVVSRHGLGSLLGLLAPHLQSLRLGTPASGSLLPKLQLVVS